MMGAGITTEFTRCPVVARRTLALARLVSLDLLGPVNHPLRFEREIVTVRETESVIVWVSSASGNAIRTGPRHNDFYGLFTSPRDLIEAAKEATSTECLTPGAAIRIEVRTTVREEPRIETDKIEFGRRAFVIPPPEWIIADGTFEDALDEAAREVPWDARLAAPTYLKASATEATHVVWRSDRNAVENGHLLAAGRLIVFDGVEEPAP